MLMAQRITDLATALAWATERCARRECCRQDITQKLRDTPLSPEAIEEVLSTLEEEKYIDHARYAHAFVHDKLAYDRWGRLKIVQALRLKAVDRQDIEQALSDELVLEDYRASLTDLLLQKLRTLRFDTNDRHATYLAQQKLVRFAASRGYEAEYIFDAIDHLALHD